MTEPDREELLAKLIAERDELEKAIPPHGLKPGHMLRIEELEDRIDELRKLLARTED